MKLLTEKMSVGEVRRMAERLFGNLVKAVVDVRLRHVVVDAELHSDEEAFLLAEGSKQQDLWGINLYPDMDPNGPDFIEFDSMINLRPNQKNRSRGVEDERTRALIAEIVREWIR